MHRLLAVWEPGPEGVVALHVGADNQVHIPATHVRKGKRRRWGAFSGPGRRGKLVSGPGMVNTVLVLVVVAYFL